MPQEKNDQVVLKKVFDVFAAGKAVVLESASGQKLLSLKIHFLPTAGMDYVLKA